MAEPLLRLAPRVVLRPSHSHSTNSLREFPRSSPLASLKPRATLPLDRRHSISSFGYTQSKALIYSTYGEPSSVLSLHSYSISPPTSTSITLRMLTAPINPADINQIQGVYPSKPPMTTTLGTSEPSAVGGNEGVAEVVALGSQVKSVQKGDWVIMRSTALGTWRTHLALDESQVFKIENKDNLTPLQVGTVSVNPCTAYRMLLDFSSWSFRGDEWFVQNGANSGVGRAAIQLGKEWGLKSINVVRDREDKNELDKLKKELISLGATKVVTESELQGKDFRDQVKSWTSSSREPIKLALNCVGGKPATVLAKTLSPGATMVTYGAMSKQPLILPASMLIFKEVSFAGFWVSRWGDKNPEQKRQTVNDVLRLTREGKFKDIPVQECQWDRDTEVGVLKEAVQGTLEGFRKGKGVFVFGDT
jgi:mitochondrial enoyl-[acyl-carrier protein] reductase / trans-2-enoyl-CoA reductase